MHREEVDVWRPVSTEPAIAQLPTEWLFMVDLDAWECMVVSELPISAGSIAAKVADATVLPLKTGLAKQCFGALPLTPLI